MKKRAMLAFIVFLMGSYLYSQSLVELAKKEKERRENLKNKNSQVITNSHLSKTKKGEAIAIPQTEAKEERAENSESVSPPPYLINTPTLIRTDPDISKGEEPADPNSVKNLEEKSKKADEMVSLLNLKMNALYQVYYNGDELTPRHKIEKEIAETYQQLLEAQKEADKLKAELERAQLISKKKK
ncbi:MAG: hypothetical protein JW755_06990 [Candidatus Aminicenantes bacterium]|nr:hypothetical protein [Candidatus Aminicenantes bacterium]